jgi:prolipoprotein diacylglyceryltransferase
MQIAYYLHSALEWLAILLAVQSYRLIKKYKHQPSILQGDSFKIVLGCIFGAAIGNKIAFALEYPQLITQNGWLVLLQGQSIVGGLLGGLLGVEFIKKINSLNYSTGDDFILPLIIGTIIGRVGCFLAGLYDATYGNATQLPWGIDFGDGIYRHPTQLYDIVFVSFIALILYKKRKALMRVSGLSFKLYLASYLLWRLFIDSFKPVPYAYWLELSGIQWLCIMALILYLPLVWRELNTARRL